MEIGVIGLGLMGRPMACNLLRAGHRVHIWARRAGALAPLVEAGAIVQGSAAEVAAHSEIVLTVVADAQDVEAVTLGDGGVADGANPGLVLVDLSTIAPAAARDIAARLAVRGVTMLDAPVSGGETGAINASLTIMVGGPDAAFEQVRPVLACLGTTITHVGGNGAGQVAKACNQILTGVGIVAVAEAIELARANGVDPARVRTALLGGSAYSRILESHGARMLAEEFRPGFKAWMHQKDLRIVMEEAHRNGLFLPSAAVAAQLFNAMLGSGLGEEDSVAVIKLLRRWRQLDEARSEKQRPD